MNIKHNINYFKMSDLLTYISIGLMAVGLPLFIFAYGFLYIMSIIMLPLGAVGFIIGVSIRSSEKDLDLTIKKETEDLCEDLNENAKYARRVVKRLPPFVAEGYEYEEGVHLRRSRSGITRSSRFTKSYIYILKDGVYIKSRTVSLVGEPQKNKNTEVTFDLLKDIEYRKEEKKLTYGKKEFTVKCARLYFRYVNGLSFSLPADNEIKARDIIERVTHDLNAYRKSREEQ